MRLSREKETDSARMDVIKQSPANKWDTAEVE